jgi:hypothetical protein
VKKASTSRVPGPSGATKRRVQARDRQKHIADYLKAPVDMPVPIDKAEFIHFRTHFGDSKRPDFLMHSYGLPDRSRQTQPRSHASFHDEWEAEARRLIDEHAKDSQTTKHDHFLEADAKGHKLMSQQRDLYVSLVKRDPRFIAEPAVLYQILQWRRWLIEAKYKQAKQVEDIDLDDVALEWMRKAPSRAAARAKFAKDSLAALGRALFQIVDKRSITDDFEYLRFKAEVMPKLTFAKELIRKGKLSNTKIAKQVGLTEEEINCMRPSQGKRIKLATAFSQMLVKKFGDKAVKRLRAIEKTHAGSDLIEYDNDRAEPAE